MKYKAPEFILQNQKGPLTAMQKKGVKFAFFSQKRRREKKNVGNQEGLSEKDYKKLKRRKEKKTSSVGMDEKDLGK